MKKSYVIVAILCGTFLSKTYGMEHQISAEEKQKRNAEIMRTIIRTTFHPVLSKLEAVPAPAPVVTKQEKNAEIMGTIIKTTFHSVLVREEKEQKNISYLENK